MGKAVSQLSRTTDQWVASARAQIAFLDQSLVNDRTLEGVSAARAFWLLSLRALQAWEKELTALCEQAVPGALDTHPEMQLWQETKAKKIGWSATVFSQINELESLNIDRIIPINDTSAEDANKLLIASDAEALDTVDAYTALLNDMSAYIAECRARQSEW